MPKRPPFDPATAVAHLRASDPKLRALIDRVGPYALERQPSDSLFASLLRSIVYQQLNGKAASTIHGRVLAELARHGGTTAAALAKSSDAALRAAGLSANKLKAVRDLAEKCLAGSVPQMEEVHGLSDDELVGRLTQVRGIGPWTVHMLLIFTLGRPDVMPTGDFAIRQAFKKLHRKRKDPTPEAILKHARCWQPYRSVASWYLWRSLDD
jgi:3-methyladenine DNA glycosylase/8-oxoguanine DNA glycosylase